ISVVMTVVVFLLRPQPLIVNPAGAPVAALAVMAVSIILYIWLILKSSRPIAVCDVGGSPLRGACVQAGQIMGLITAILFFVRYGEAGFEDMLPLWAGLLGAGLYRFADNMLRVKSSGG
ncbi:MAG: hypothetical protein RBT34_13610, partial [Anaerolineaceae bacterium]|nr:hypothetical protein [Anaerolineaceae bacterium]